MDRDRRPPAVRRGSEGASRCRFFWSPSDLGGSVLRRKEQSVPGVIRRLHTHCGTEDRGHDGLPGSPACLRGVRTALGSGDRHRPWGHRMEDT